MLDFNLACSETENRFGPAVASQCLQGFDFTWLFEETILTIAPLGIALALAFIRIATLKPQTAQKIKSQWLCYAKVSALLLHGVLQIALIGLWSSTSIPERTVSIVTAALEAFGSGVFIYVSRKEHLHSIRPSTILSVYYFLAVFFDAARVRTLWIASTGGAVPVLQSVVFAVKVVIFLLESIEKRNFLVSAREYLSPLATAGAFNRAVFWWLNPTLLQGYKSDLSLENLAKVDEDVKSESNFDSLEEQWNQAKKDRPLALFGTFVVHYKWAILSAVPAKLASVALTFAQPFLVQRVLDYIQGSVADESANFGYGLIGAYAIVYIGIAVSNSIYEFKVIRSTALIRDGLVSLIFNETLDIYSSQIEQSAALTLMSADVERITTGVTVVHELWAGLVSIGIALWLLDRLLGVAVAASAGLVIFTVLCSTPLAILLGNFQSDWLEAVESRIAVTANLLGILKPIRMSGLSGQARSILTELRSAEIKASASYRYVNVALLSLSYMSQSLAPVLGFAVYVFSSEASSRGPLTDAVAFSALTIFSLLDTPLSSLVDAMEDLSVIISCFGRVQKYLRTKDNNINNNNTIVITDGCSETTSEKFSEKSPLDIDDNTSVLIKDGSVWWDSEDRAVLKDLNLQIKKSSVTAIVGPVGSGKSTFLKMILGETHHSSGVVLKSFKEAAYCSQAPWITNASVRENIIGKSAFDPKWYDTVISACGLDVDFRQLPGGDQTVVGSRGTRLSGGQQMRVSFARALYSRRSTVILDDVLVGLDYSTQQKILTRVFEKDGLLRNFNATTIIATNNSNILSISDYIIVLGADGRVAQQGTFNQLKSSPGYIEDVLSQKDTTNQVSGKSMDADADFILDDTTDPLEELSVFNEPTEDMSRRAGDMTVYKYYFATAGWIHATVFFSISVAFVFTVSFPQVWLNKWTNANDQHGDLNLGYWVGIYFMLGALSMIAAFVDDGYLELIIFPRTARRFHDALLDTTFGASTSFLTSTDTGVITNRFSQDLELIDMELPSALQTFIVIFLNCIAQGVLVFIGGSYAAAIVPGVVAVIYIIQKFYLRTSRQMRLLDIEAKAPIFSTFLEVLSGLATIRAYGWKPQYRETGKVILGRSQRPFFLMYCIQRWLNVVLELMVAGLATVVVGVAVATRGTKSAGFLGVSLYSIVDLGSSLQGLVTQWTELETSIGAVSRIRTYAASTPREHDNAKEDAVSPPPEWPASGHVEFRHVSASYDSSETPVLRDVSFTVKPGEKVAICGRTGSGKSSLATMLLRLLEPSNGSIIVDGIDIAKVSPEMIRSRLVALSQEAFILPGTIRTNLDPYGTCDENQILDILATLGLHDLIASKGGLDEEVEADSFSQGQRQLLCLARAACRKSSVYIFDEVTSSLDSLSQKSAAQLISSRLANHTVLSVTHQLNSILDYDKILLLDQGVVKEFGNPRILLQQDDSAFRALYMSLESE